VCACVRVYVCVCMCVFVRVFMCECMFACVRLCVNVGLYLPLLSD